jgi:hypothetical protein
MMAFMCFMVKDDPKNLQNPNWQRSVPHMRPLMNLVRHQPNPRKRRNENSPCSHQRCVQRHLHCRQQYRNSTKGTLTVRIDKYRVPEDLRDSHDALEMDATVAFPATASIDFRRYRNPSESGRNKTPLQSFLREQREWHAS